MILQCLAGKTKETKPKSFPLFLLQRSGRNASNTTPQMCKSHESFGNRADKKEKMRHNHFIKTAQPYKPKVGTRDEDTAGFTLSSLDWETWLKSKCC